MTASQTLTPSQARFMREHKARRERFAAKARPDTPILCLSASARSQRAEVPPAILPEPIPPVQEWAERQLERFKPPWFMIVEEIDPPKLKNPPIRVIQKATAKHYGVTVEEMVSERRPGHIVRPRQVAVYLSKVLTPRSLPEIGRQFGGRDHSTILFTFRKIDRLLESDVELREQVQAIKADIGAAYD